MERKNKFSYLLIFILVPLIVSAQKYSFKNFSIEQGLPQAYVYSMFQNPEGFITVSTGKGNALFNGATFKPIAIPNLAAEDFVTASFIDQAGNIWYGCFSGNIYACAGNKETKLVYKASSLITHFCENKSGALLATTRSNGLLLLDNTKFSCQEICADCKAYMLNSAEFVNRHLLLLGSSNGLLLYSLTDKKIIPAPQLNDYEINCITQGSMQNLFWIGTKEKGVFEISIDENLNFKLLHNIAVEEGLSSNNVQSILLDNSKNLWVGTVEGGINKIATNQNYKVRFFNEAAGLTSDFVKSSLIDNEGNLWLGTYGGGLFRLDIDPFELINVKDGLRDNNITAIESDAAGNFWFGTNQGITQLNFEKNQSKQITVDKGLVSDKITALYLDKAAHRLWVGTADKGICTLELENGKINNFNHQPPLEGDYINAIGSDKLGNIWISTTLSGAYKFDGEFTQYSTKNGLGHNYVYQAFGDSKGKVWFGTHAGSLNYFDKGKVQEYSSKLGISIYDFNSFCEDKNGNIWTATFGNGFVNISISPKVVITTNQGLVSNYCYGIICDRDNNLWVTQKNYLAKFNPIRQNLKTFSNKDLFGDNQFNINATHLDKDGNVWLGSVKGAVKYLYSIYNTNKTEAKPSITHFRVFNENKDLTTYLTLPYSSYSVSFEFEALSFKKSEEVLYKYMLAGRDNDWCMATSIKFVNYANLADGEYTFKLLACNNDGLWNTEPVTISFTINPPLWKSWWFWTVLLLILIATVAIYVNIRAKQLKRQRDELQRMVDNKTKELSQEKSLVESQNKIIRAKNKDIQDSINYAQKIQDAILPDINELRKNLSDVFILYQPREVVSGDFYWYTQVDNSMIMVAADCTGHGVPGALMSMIGNALLREIILLNQIYSPHKILYALDEGIISTLNQGGAEKERKDGMAISICKIIADKKQISFASSQQSLIHIGKNGAREIKGEFFSIGDYEVTDKKFENHLIPYESEDMIYLFSDGYLDQFGGAENRKFMKKRFIDLLLEICHLEGSFQKAALEKNLAAWKGEKNQTDDVMVIGIRL
ncbi:MAG: SpoIIE family protein phosphatase [Bacteroidetes bacterium]|nr:SpoIIE family protein phosphatase [Bacteroidota bacterium]